MTDPLTALIIGSSSLIAIVILFLPEKGILARMKKNKLDSKKVLVEDALKYIYDFEYKNARCTINNVASGLGISSDAAAKLKNKLVSQKLVEFDSEYIKLTKEGKLYALRVIRVHRLWEKYLAEETGINEVDWHSQAELKEHLISLEEANELAVKMNNPLFDPHGDPIPTRSGKLPSPKGVALSSLKDGEFGHIVHLEDEPTAVYAQIIAIGLYPGMQIKMIDSSKERIIFEANGEEKILAPVFAENISVAVIENEKEVTDNFLTLSSLAEGSSAKVAGISRACRGKQRRRLMDLGIVPGTSIAVLMKSIGGDPVAYIVRDTTIALRKEQSDKIFITNSE